MTTLRPFQATDVLRFNAVNADAWTATVSCRLLTPLPPSSFISQLKGQYHTGYYANYVATWPTFCITAEGPRGDVQAYSACRVLPWISPSGRSNADP